MSLIDPDDAAFLAPADMPEAIRDFCRRTGQTRAARRRRRASHARSRAWRCAIGWCSGWLEELIGGRIETIHIVGGGSQNRQLCQATADACQRTVFAGPVEATAIGNVLVQAIAAGDLGSIGEARQLVARQLRARSLRTTPRGPVGHGIFKIRTRW